MKRIVFVVFILLLPVKLYTYYRCFHDDDDDKVKSSRTFMFSRPINQTTFIQQSGWHDLIYNKCTNMQGVLQAYVTSWQTQNYQPDAAQYFLPECRDHVLVAGDDAPGNKPSYRYRDVRAEWLGIDNTQFQGSFTISPYQKQWAVTLEYNQDLSTFFSGNFFKNYWLSVALPIAFIENDLRFKQSAIANPGIQGPRDLIAAFNQDAWRFAHMSQGKQNVVAVAEICLRLGRAFLADDFFEIAYYTLFRIPTYHGQNPRYIFSPFVGNNKHVGFGGGVDFQIPITNADAPYAVTFFTTLEATFLLDRDDRRTFDLKDKKWSRYLQFNIKDGPPDQNIPGANVLTICTKVRPYGHFEMNLGWRLNTQHFEGEIGYGIWGHADEMLEPKEGFDEIYGIAGTGPNNKGLATTASTSTIQQKGENDVNENGDPLFVQIRVSDLDFHSAAAQSVINHKIHGAVSYLHCKNCYDGVATFGVFWEYPQRNAAMQICGFWIKLGISL